MRLSYLIRFACIFLLTGKLYATHIVGGSISLVHVSGDQYKLQLKVLRDCLNGQADFDRPATIGMFNKATNQQVQVFSMQNPTITKLDFSGPNCAPIPNACTQLGFYERTITFNPTTYNSTSGYYFVYMRCCRNNIILNISNPQDAGIAIYTEVPPFILRNSTPVFNNNPHTYLCTNNLFTYNFEFTDKDGDSLKYTMVTPLNGTLDRNDPITNNPDPGPYPTTNWLPGYSDNAQILGNPNLNINTSTGELEVSPLQAGVYVAAIKVEEYRFGVKLGEVRLELQFQVTACPPNGIPSINFTGTQGEFLGSVINVQVPNRICFDIKVADLTDSVYTTISGAAFKDTTLATQPTITDSLPKGMQTTTSRFCWQTTCEMANTQHLFYVNTVDNGCPFPNKAKSNFLVKINPMPLVSSIDILCVHLFDDHLEFDYGDSVISSYFSKYYVYRSSDNGPFELIDSISDKSIRSYSDYTIGNPKLIDYKYYVRAVNLCGIPGPTSDTISSFENLSQIPRQQRLYTVTVEDNMRVKIIWPKTPENDFARYTLYKSKRDETEWQFLSEFTSRYDTVFTDENVDVNAFSYCYHLVMRDTCSNIGPNGRKACTILLKGTSVPFTHNLSWTPYTYWEKGTSQHDVYRKNHLVNFDVNASLANVGAQYTDDKLDTKSGLYNYYIRAVEGEFIPNADVLNALHTSTSNTIELIQSPLLYVPNAFTPNGDLVNDILGIRDVFVKDYNLKIYNRWGQLVFETNDKNVQWDGFSLSGNRMPDDVYVYIVTYTGWDGSADTKRGNITLIR